METKPKRNKGSRAKLREFFIDNVGKILDSEILREVAGTSEWGRRVRELRNEEGFNILTHNDRSDLKPGQYLLPDLITHVPAFERDISKETRAIVLDRDGFTCQMCGVAAGELHPYNGRKVQLQLGHIIDKSMGGTDDPSNLRAICSVCNEGASNLTLNRPDAIKLLAQIRRAPMKDQLVVLKWLQQKFPEQSKDMEK